MELERVQVLTRDEYQCPQDPIVFHWRGRDFHVVDILDRWYEGYMDPTRLPLRYFRVLTQEGSRFILRYHEFFRAWSLVVPREETED